MSRLLVSYNLEWGMRTSKILDFVLKLCYNSIIENKRKRVLLW